MKRALLIFSIILALSTHSSAQLSPTVRKVINIASPSIVKVTADMSKGTMICTGFVINTVLRQVLTAKHCITENDKLLKAYVDGRPAIILKDDNWLVLLQPMAIDKPALKVRKSPLQSGETTYAFGYGMNLPTVLIRPVIWVLDNNVAQEAFTVDGYFIAGMSGGPVVDASGDVVGMVQKSDQTMGYASGPGAIKAFLK